MCVCVCVSVKGRKGRKIQPLNKGWKMPPTMMTLIEKGSKRARKTKAELRLQRKLSASACWVYPPPLRPPCPGCSFHMGWWGGVLEFVVLFYPLLGQGCNVVSAPLIYLRSSPVWCVCVCACLYRCCRQTVKRARESRDSSPGRITVTIRRARTNTSPWRRFCLRYARTVSHRSKWSRSRGLC